MESLLGPSNEILRKLLFSLNEGVCLHKLIVDECGKPVDYEFLEINPAFEVLASLTKSDLTNKNATEVYKCLRPPFMDIFSVTASSGKPASIEALLALTQKPVKISIIPLDKNLFFAIYNSIAEDTRVGEPLEEDLTLNQIILSYFPNPIVIFHPDTTVLYVNRAFNKLTGFTSTEVKGVKMPYPWWPEERIQLFYNGVEPFPINDIISRSERSLKKKNGVTFWVEMTNVPVKKDGQIKYRLSTWTDITQLKQTEQSLIETDSFNRDLLDNSPNPITLLNPDGSIEYVNKAFEQLTGWTRAEIKGLKSPFPWWIKDKTQEYLKTGGDSHLINTYDRHERLLQKKNGDYFWAEMTSVSVKRSETLTYRLGMWNEITQRKLAEENNLALYEKEKTARQELQEEAKVRGLFIDVLAHELRTPLTPIMASTSMLKDILEDRHSAIENRLVTNIQSGANTLTRRLEELLDLARFSRGTFKLNPQPTDLAILVRQSIAHFQDMLNDRHQKLICEIAENLPIAEVDPSKLDQVIGNLLSNASKFSPDNVEIVVKSFQADSSFVFSVTDSGIGITKEEQNRLFKPYHRVEQDRQKFPGIGLGLAICRQIIEAHHGKIWITSQQNQGSTFHFSIPIAPLS